jgi:hypothetical protein
MVLRLLALSLVLASFAASAAPTYALRYDAADEVMSVRLCVPDAAATVRFSGDSRYVEDLARDSGDALVRDQGGWSAHAWRAGECLAYRASLRPVADAGRRRGIASRGRDLVVDPELWLLRAEGADDAQASVELPPGYAISAPWHPLPSSGDTKRFRIPQTPDDWMARVAIGRISETRIELPGGALRLAILDGADAEQRKRLGEWIAHVSRAALSAYGRLPLADVQVLIVPVGRADKPVVFGQSTRGQGHGLTLFVDPSRPAAEFDRDWVAVHELSHLFHPYLGGRGAWLAEGLATYYQNVLRARAGLLAPGQAWEQIDAGFARGRSDTRAGNATLEEAADGYGNTHAYMRVYWSGTAYWLEVDAELRRASADRLSVDEALRRFDACCLPSYRRWEPAEFVAKLDSLLGTDVVARRFGQFRARRDFPDTAALYAALGIVRDGDSLRFDDTAQAAGARQAIMQPRP